MTREIIRNNLRCPIKSNCFFIPISSQQPGFPQEFEAGNRFQHQTGSGHTHDKVENNAGEQGVAEGINRTGGRYGRPEQEGLEHGGPDAGGRPEHAQDVYKRQTYGSNRPRYGRRAFDTDESRRAGPPTI